MARFDWELGACGLSFSLPVCRPEFGSPQRPPMSVAPPVSLSFHHSHNHRLPWLMQDMLNTCEMTAYATFGLMILRRDLLSFW